MVKYRLFEQPRIYIVFGLGLLLFEILNTLSPDETITVGLRFTFYVLFLSVILWLTSITLMKGRLRINNVANNTPESIGIALLMVMGLLGVSTLIGWGLGYASNIWTANSIAMIGAIPQFILENHAFLSFIIIVFFLATLESMVVAQLGDNMLSIANSNYTLRDKKVWVTAIILGTGATIYHSYSKFIPSTGQLNIHALAVVWVLFTSGFLLAVYRKEMESFIEYHIINNFLAVAYRLKEVLRVFGM